MEACGDIVLNSRGQLGARALVQRFQAALVVNFDPPMAIGEVSRIALR